MTSQTGVAELSGPALATAALEATVDEVAVAIHAGVVRALVHG